MKITYQIFEEHKLFCHKLHGKFTYELYAQYARTVLSKVQSQSEKIAKVLVDFRDLEFSHVDENVPDYLAQNIERMSAMRNQMIQENPNTQNTLIAFWVDKPLPTAIALLFTANFPKNYTYCSTVENVNKILQIQDDTFDIEVKLKNLENCFDGIPV